MDRIYLTLICLVLATTNCCSDEVPKFPNIKALSENGFISKVEVSGQPENSTVLVEEFFDATDRVTKVNLLRQGHRQIIVIRSKFDQVASVEHKKCDVKPAAEAESFLNPLFPNWLHSSEGDKEVYYGPTSILRRAADNPPQYSGKATARGMDCHVFTDVDPDREDVNIKYFFTANWTTPVNISKSVLLPVQIQLFGQGTPMEGSPDEQYVQYVDYIYFIPSVKNPTVLQLPYGIGCKGLKYGEESMPPMPKRFTVVGEQFFPSESSTVMSVSTFRVWYDYIAKLARLDIYEQDNLGVSKVLDYNTGVMYVTRQNEECSSSPISDKYFDEITGDLRLVLKDPDSFMGMKGDYYYLGKKFIRGIYCDVWESVVEQEKNRIVNTYFISSRYWEIDVEGEIEEQVPIRLESNNYEEGKEDPTSTSVFNFFHFSKHPPLVYSQFSIEFCASSVPDKKYILILMYTDIDNARQAEKVAENFKEKAENKIIKIAGISPIRMPYVRVDFEPTVISIMALILERAPALDQFVKAPENDAPKSKETNKGIFKTAELCAEECIKLEVCVSFHYCSGKGECYVSITDLTEDVGDDLKGPKSCALYERHGAGSYIKDVLLKDALDNLDKNISTGKFVIGIPAEEGSEKDDVEFTATEFIPDFTPVTTGDRDKDMFSKVIGQQKFKKVQTTRAAEDSLSAGECYRKCRNEENIACSSFSFCIDTNECLLSSVLVLPKKNIDYELESDPMCAVYSIEYLQMFEEYKGQIRISPGKEAISVNSASECAKSCREREKTLCRGFDFCSQKKQCVLHDRHVLDIKEGDLTNVGSGCSHYALKYIGDFDEVGRFILSDPKAKSVSGASVEKCAKICSENMELKCQSFDFCPNTEFEKTKCTLNTATIIDDDVSSEDSDTCQHYEKKLGIVDDFLNSRQVKASEPSGGYTSGGLAGVIIGVLIFGITVGILGFLIYSYVRKSRFTEERSVRFMKQENA